MSRKFLVPIEASRVTGPLSSALLIDGQGAGGQVRLQTNSSTRMTVSDTNVSYNVPVFLAADPASATEAATKQYVDAIVVIAATDPIAANPGCELWLDTST